MFYFSIILLLAAIGAFFALRSSRETKGMVGWVVTGILVFSLLSFIKSIVRTVEPGNVGIPVTFGRTGKPFKQGLHLTSPFTSVENISIRTENYVMAAAAGEGQVGGDDAVPIISKDGVSGHAEAAIEYRVSEDKASDLYRLVGTNYEDKVVRNPIRTALRDAIARHNIAGAIASELPQITEEVTADLGKTFTARGLVLERVNIRAITPNDQFKAAMDSKQQVQQQAQASVFKKQQATQEAQVRVIEAEGIAKSQKIIQSTLTSQYLQHEYIKTLGTLANSPNTTIFVTPIDGKLAPQFVLGDTAKKKDEPAAAPQTAEPPTQ